MPFTVALATDRLHIVGDSITAFKFHDAPGGLRDLIQRANPAAVPAIAGRSGIGAIVGRSGVGATSGRTGTWASNSSLALTASGGAGNRIADINGAIAGRITAFNPTKLIIECAVNDATLGTVPATFLSTYQSVITAALAANVGLTQIGMMTAMCSGELWAAGGSPWGANANDTAIANINAQLDTLVTNNPGVCFKLDVRTPLGLWLQTHAPGPPGAASGVTTSDGTHPNGLGNVLLGQWCMQAITVAA